jgi:hypothetical protein
MVVQAEAEATTTTTTTKCPFNPLTRSQWRRRRILPNNLVYVMCTQTSGGPHRKSRGPLYTHQPVRRRETLTLNAPDLDLTSKSRVRLPVYRRNYFDETVQLHARPIISCKKNQPLHFYFIHSFNRFLKDVIAHNILSDIIVCIY